jgi:hypothetical protein
MDIAQLSIRATGRVEYTIPILQVGNVRLQRPDDWHNVKCLIIIRSVCIQVSWLPSTVPALPGRQGSLHMKTSSQGCLPSGYRIESEP